MKKIIRVLLAVCLLGLVNEPIGAMSGFKKAAQLFSKKIYKVVGFTTSFGLGYKFFSLKKFKTEEKGIREQIEESVKKGDLFSASEQDLVNFIKNSVKDDEVVKIIFKRAMAESFEIFTEKGVKWGHVYEALVEKMPRNTLVELSNRCWQQLYYKNYAKDSKEVAAFMNFLGKYPKLLPLVLYESEITLHLPDKEFTDLMKSNFDDMAHQIKGYHKDNVELFSDMTHKLARTLSRDVFSQDQEFLKKASRFIFMMALSFWDSYSQLRSTYEFGIFLKTHFELCSQEYIDILKENMWSMDLKGAEAEMNRVLGLYNSHTHKKQFESFFNELIDDKFVHQFSNNPFMYGAFFKKKEKAFDPMRRRIIESFIKYSIDICKIDFMREYFLIQKLDKDENYFYGKTAALMRDIFGSMTSEDKKKLAENLVSEKFIESVKSGFNGNYYTTMVANLLITKDEEIIKLFECYYLDRLKSNRFSYAGEIGVMCNSTPLFSQKTVQKIAQFILENPDIWVNEEHIESLLEASQQYKMDEVITQLQEFKKCI